MSATKWNHYASLTGVVKINLYNYEKVVLLHSNAAVCDYITLNVPPVALSIVPLQKMSLSVRQSYDYF